MAHQQQVQGLANKKHHSSDNILWVDLEMTGLDPDTDRILEVAALVTNSELEEIDTLHLVIHESDEVLNRMNAWCIQHHGSSGLTDSVKKSNITLKDAEERLLVFIKKYFPEKSAVLAGNSVYMDKFFIMRHMPLVSSYLHYRIIDVSSIKTLVSRWYPLVEVPKKSLQHRALEDIRESITELKFYRKRIFKDALK